MSNKGRVNTGVKKSAENKGSKFKLSPEAKVILPVAGVIIFLLAIFFWYKNYTGTKEYQTHKKWYKAQTEFIKCFKEVYEQSSDTLTLELGDKYSELLSSTLSGLRTAGSQESKVEYDSLRFKMTKKMVAEMAMDSLNFKTCDP